MQLIIANKLSSLFFEAFLAVCEVYQCERTRVSMCVVQEAESILYFSVVHGQLNRGGVNWSEVQFTHNFEFTIRLVDYALSRCQRVKHTIHTRLARLYLTLLC